MTAGDMAICVVEACGADGRAVTVHANTIQSLTAAM